MIGGVVEHLDLEEVARVIDGAGGGDDALGDAALVEHGELNGDARESGGEELRFGRGVGGGIAAMEESPDHVIAVQAVDADDRDHGEVVCEEWSGKGLHGVGKVVSCQLSDGRVRE